MQSSQYKCVALQGNLLESYYRQVIKNGIKEFEPRVKIEEPKISVIEEHYETKYKSKTRQALEDFEEEYDE